MNSPVHAGEADRWGGWHWREPSHGEHFRRCSYCGSIHPDDFVTIARGRVEWADWKYGWPHKFYVHVPNPNPETLFYIGAMSNVKKESIPEMESRGWILKENLTDEHKAILERDGAMTEWSEAYQFGPRRDFFGKVYTVHLADPDISDEVKEQAKNLCGLKFEFISGGRISWQGI